MALTIILIIIAAIAKTVMDKLSFRYYTLGFKNEQFWNPSISWKNKYKDGNPCSGPKFPLSTTALVFLTDGWHLMQFIFLNCMFLGLALYTPIFNWWADFLIYSILFRVIFNLIYNKNFSKS